MLRTRLLPIGAALAAVLAPVVVAAAQSAADLRVGLNHRLV